MNEKAWLNLHGFSPETRRSDQFSTLSHEQLLLLAHHNEKQVTDLTAEVSKTNAHLNTLARENDYLMATLSDIRAGLDALNYHIMTASSSDELPPDWTDFRQAFEAVKLTHTALRNAIDEWESKFVDHINEIPF